MFGEFSDFEYGKPERKRVRRIENAAKTLVLTLNDLGALKELVSQDLIAARNLPPVAFQLALCDLSRLDSILESKLVDGIDPGFSQIFHVLRLFEQFDLDTAIAKDTGGVAFRPSSFVRFIMRLWEIRPGLRVYEPTGSKAANFSQWLYEKRDQAKRANLGTGSPRE
jgi:hypothetical protein